MQPNFQQGVNLAYWLYRVHPGIFKALRSQAAATSGARGLSGLGDNGDADVSFVIGTDNSTPDPGMSFSVVPEGSFPAISPDLTAMPDPALQSVGIDAATPDISIPIDEGASAAAGAPAAATATSSSAGGIGGALASVGGFLASATGLTALTNLATAAYRAGTPQAATIGTQVARVSNGALPAAITYKYNSAGQLVPVLTQGSATVALSPQGLSSLIPSSLSTYAIPIGLGLLLLWAMSKRG